MKAITANQKNNPFTRDAKTMACVKKVIIPAKTKKTNKRFFMMRQR
jgi:hypothetical protein